RRPPTRPGRGRQDPPRHRPRPHRRPPPTHRAHGPRRQAPQTTQGRPTRQHRRSRDAPPGRRRPAHPRRLRPPTPGRHRDHRLLPTDRGTPPQNRHRDHQQPRAVRVAGHDGRPPTRPVRRRPTRLHRPRTHHRRRLLPPTPKTPTHPHQHRRVR